MGKSNKVVADFIKNNTGTDGLVHVLPEILKMLLDVYKEMAISEHENIKTEISNNQNNNAFL